MSFGYSLNSKAMMPAFLNYYPSYSGYMTHPSSPGYSGYDASCMAVGVCPGGGSYGPNYSWYGRGYGSPMERGFHNGWGTGYHSERFRNKTQWNMWAGERNGLSSNPYYRPNWPSPIMGWAYGTGQVPGRDMVEGGTANILMHPPPPPLPSSHFGHFGISPNQINGSSPAGGSGAHAGGPTGPYTGP
jgi:hypothetical protein